MLNRVEYKIVVHYAGKFAYFRLNNKGISRIIDYGTHEELAAWLRNQFQAIELHNLDFHQSKGR